MRTRLSKEQIGQRITALRKAKGFSQDDLARLVKISRSSLAQIELGNRGVDILELQNLSIALEFSIDEFMSPDFCISEIPDEPAVPAKPKTDIRISVPSLSIPKFKNVLLYILERCAGKPNVGETVLYRLLYFIDFNYYELYEEHLTGAAYRKMPYGPVPQKLDTVITQMINKGQLQRIKTDYHGYPQTRYLPLEKADLTLLKASEKEMIDKVMAQLSDWSASALSVYSHKDLPWMASKDGETINYELSFYREAPFSVRNYNNETEER